MAEVVEADAAECGSAEQGVEVSGEGCSLDRGAVGPGDDVAARLPARLCRLTFLALPVAVLFEGAQALGGQSDAPLRAPGLARQGDKAAGVGELERAADAGGAAGQVEVLPSQAQQFALAEPVRRASSNSTLNRSPLVAVRKARASSAVKGSKRRGRSVPMRTLRESPLRGRRVPGRI